MKRRNIKLSDQNTDMKANPVEIRATRGMMRGQHKVAEHQMLSLETQLADAEVALEKLAGEKSRTESDLGAQQVTVEESPSAKNAHAERLEHECAKEAKKRQWLLAEPRERSRSATHLLAECEESGPTVEDSRGGIGNERIARTSYLGSGGGKGSSD